MKLIKIKKDKKEKKDFKKSTKNHNLDQNDKVAIILTCYNTEKYIYDSIKSILDQSYYNFDFFIIDDNSTDNTVSIIKTFTDPRIIFIQNPINRGTYYCKNLALKQIEINIDKYKYIAFQDSDDTSHIDRIKIQINELKKRKVLMTSVLGVYNNKNIFAPITILFDIKVFEDLGYFDLNRFGCDSEFLFRFYKFYKLKHNKFNLKDNFCFYVLNFENYYYLIKKKLYFVKEREDSLTKITPLSSNPRLIYKKNYTDKINNFKNPEEYKYSFDL
jgi:glycosyltransferase involved in cell wall biosynthesis